MINKLVGIVIFMVLLLGFSTTSTYALKHNYDPTLLADMYRNPKNYIALGGAGTGLSLYMDKNSINVHEYNPPYYIIAFKKVSFYVHPSAENNGQWVEDAESSIERYYYDFDNKKMYWEHKYLYPVEKTEWEYIDPQKSDSTSGSRAMFAAGEIAFFLAYNMNFYGNPKSYFMQEYSKRGDWVNFGTKN